ncbi:MAG: DUF1674 domain-containing protein [Wenzhouxiangellaceae bacterium]|nr:DUF1674 domain-containing protein [Wenzhouxiangellaceae bacterium]
MSGLEENSTERVQREQASDAAIDRSDQDQISEEPAAREYGGQKGPEPTRYGDWEKNGRCSDF